MNLKDKAILVSLTVSVWTNAAHDSSVVEGIAKRTQTATDVHSYRKNLVRPEALAPIKARALALKTHWRRSTMPWGDGGVRLLPSHKYMEFIEKMRELRGDYESTAAAFAREYPKMKAEARQRLKSLFNEEDFPSIEGIKRKFGVSLEFLPIPDAADFRLSITEEERKRMRKEIEEAVQQHTKQAMASLVERMQETIEVFAERMKEDAPVLRQSLIANIKEVCEEVGDLNLVGDKHIEELRKTAVKALATNVDLDKLKTDKKARKELASAADEILKKMQGYIGG